MIKKISLIGFILIILGSNIKIFSQEKNENSDLSDFGEKLFHKLENSENLTCANCHYSIEVDTLNWNPSVYDLADRSVNYSIDEFVEIFNNVEGKVIKKAHSGYKLKAEEFKQVKSYINSLSGIEIAYKRPFRKRLFLFISVALITILLAFDKRKTKKIPVTVRKILVLGAYTVLTTLLVQESIAIGRSKDYAPIQPIKFSHTIHATDNKIDCKYCHPGVFQGKNANIPSASLCLNCHAHVREGSRTGKFEIRKILETVENNEKIEWIRIHNLPDHAYFNHMQHVKVGQIDCVKCHGDVENMHIVKQVEDLSMSWCIDCHDVTPVDFSNDYYKIYFEEFYNDLQTGVRDSIMVTDVGGRDCNRCHL
jgi:hypothetical protein